MTPEQRAAQADIVVSAIVLRDRDARILCVRKRGTSRFMLPGGKREAGEAPLETALREVREELGIALSAADVVPLGDWLSHAANEPGQTLHSTVYVALEPLESTPTPAAEIDQAQWATLDELEARDDIAPMLRGYVVPAIRGRDSAPARLG